ncbi:MAG: PHP domain-containing protein [Candidatus Bathyarchaeota archaeon]|nr:PHP domain-containing protein [Candidatus Bathyarchaeota archaeon]
MIIDLHVHSKTCSDGNLTVPQIIKEAKNRNIELLSITDHDSIGCQKQAKTLAQQNQINYVNGVELNVTFTHPDYPKPVSLDFLGYQYDINNQALNKKLKELALHRQERASQILEKLNTEFEKHGITKFTAKDLQNIQNSADGALGRPHIADYMIKQNIVKNRQEAFNTYLVKCNVPKFPLSLQDASKLIRDANGILVLAHPNDPYGTSLTKLTTELNEQTKIIQDKMLPHIDGVECWHSRNTPETTNHYVTFAQKHDLIMTGGSDCHQKPVVMGSVKIPDFVAKQFIKQF